MQYASMFKNSQHIRCRDCTSNPIKAIYGNPRVNTIFNREKLEHSTLRSQTTKGCSLSIKYRAMPANY